MAVYQITDYKSATNTYADALKLAMTAATGDRSGPIGPDRVNRQGVVRIAPGSYRIGGFLWDSTLSHVRLEIAPGASILLDSAQTDNAVMRIGSVGTTATQNISIRGCATYPAATGAGRPA